MAKILIDFDGTCVPQLPESGITSTETGAEKVLKELLENGHNIYLWTARNNSLNNPYNYVGNKLRKETSLEEAVRWFKENDIELSGINEIPGEIEIIGESRKPLADYIIDDCSLGIPKVYKEITYIFYKDKVTKECTSFWVDWNEIRNLLSKEQLL